VAAALGAFAVLFTAHDLTVGLALGALATGVLVLVGMWWFLSAAGALRALGAALVAGAVLGLLGWYLYRGVVLPVAVAAGLAIASVILSRSALSASRPARPVPDRPVARAHHPFLLMNPRSGGGKVDRFDLAGKAGGLGAEVRLLSTTEHEDVAAMAKDAVSRGVDLLGVAGGDGTQALVAAVAAESRVPFVVLSAGTRNHFAMDLGLDREDPSTGLAALYDGIELPIDLGEINGRPFVNNASFGAYAEVVQSDAYRDDKRATTLRILPEVLAGHRGARLTARVDDQFTIEAPTALLVSNNRYRLDDIAGMGRRDRLDAGCLGLISLSIHSAEQAAVLIAGTHGKGLRSLVAHEVVIDADVDQIPVGIDGESVLVSTPVVCRIRPRALLVRLPRTRPGVRSPRASLDPASVVRIAFGGEPAATS